MNEKNKLLECSSLIDDKKLEIMIMIFITMNLMAKYILHFNKYINSWTE